MAANMKAVKLRIKSVQSTMQITKAMELVASSKLRKAKERAEVCRPYFETMHQTLVDIARGNTDFSSVYARESGNEKRCYVLIAGDRGLAGGYNTNLFKCLEAASLNQDFLVLPIGKKAVEYSKRNGFACVTESFGEIAMFLLQTALRWRICSAGNLRRENLDTLIFVTQSLFPCFPSSHQRYRCCL
ncbi:MAG: FoF1 ATP synthase subunit gamma [Ruminococcus sp.]